MKKISILTATRAEYGLLKPLIIALKETKLFDVRLVVTGMHLSPEFGFTYREIEEDGIEIDDKIEILLSADTPSAISKSMGLAMISFADYFERLKPDMLIVLGDRYETLAVAMTAMNQRIPIAHLHGGEKTEGAVDEVIRHAITKLSYLHFTSTEEYRNRVIQLGESPDRVFCVGALGVENIMKEPLMNIAELEESIGFKLDEPYAVVTFHPVTLENSSSQKQITELLDACKTFKNMKFIFTKANSDADGRIINNEIDKFVINNENSLSVASLGMKRYLSALKYARIVIGNSSSGLIEAPSFGIPTINIGDRQKGRIQSESIVNCEPIKENIVNAINVAMGEEFVSKSKRAKNPYGDGNTSSKIVNTIKAFFENEKIELKKVFYDCEV